MHEEVEKELPENVFLAYDNLKITIIEHGTESLNMTNGTYDFEYSICDEYFGKCISKLNQPKFLKLEFKIFLSISCSSCFFPVAKKNLHL